MIEETENQEQSLEDLIEIVERDDLPTNVFTNEDTDPMVLLGKINEVIGYLRTLQGTIESSDTKATQALASAIQALETANTALSSSTTALTNANQALSTANTAISSANSAVETANTASTTATEAKQTAEGIAGTANQALRTAQSANTTANSASATANSASAIATEAKQTAEGIASTANQALSTANNASATANDANATANTANTTANSASTTATEAKQTANSASTTAVNANITANNANSTAQQALTTAQGKQDALTETQLNNIEAVTLLNQQVQEQESSISTLSNVKVTKTDTPNKIYGTDSNGNQTTIDYQTSQTNSANKIVRRDNNGDVLVPSTPSSNNGATSKSYVDRITDYSTNEVAIGKWIDGSTLYRKVFNYDTANTNQQWTGCINLSELNIKAVVKIYGTISDGNNANVLPVGEGQYFRNLRYNENTKWLEHINNGFNNARGYIAVEYIKN